MSTKEPRQFELVAKRVGRLTDNAAVTPLDLLKTVIDDIESGETPCDGLLIITVKRNEDSSMKVTRYRANIKREAEIALLGSQHHRAIHEWIK